MRMEIIDHDCWMNEGLKLAVIQECFQWVNDVVILRLRSRKSICHFQYFTSNIINHLHVPPCTYQPLFYTFIEHKDKKN